MFQDKDGHLSQQIAVLQEEIHGLKTRNQAELSELEEKLKLTHKKSQQDKERMHQDEVTALTQEWNSERKVSQSSGGRRHKLLKHINTYVEYCHSMY